METIKYIVGIGILSIIGGTILAEIIINNIPTYGLNPIGQIIVYIGHIIIGR